MNKQLNKNKSELKQLCPIILVFSGALGITGAVITAIKATPKALAIIDYESRNRSKEHYDEKLGEWVGDMFTIKDAVSLTWKCYIPSVLIGLTTIACITGISVVNNKYHSERRR